MLPDVAAKFTAPSAMIWPAVIPCPVCRLAFFPAATLPVTIAPDEVSSIFPRDAASPAIDRRPVSVLRITSSSAETASTVMPLAALTTTFFFEVIFLASTCLLFDCTETPSRPDALPSDILPSAESVSSPALAAISLRMRTPAPLSVTTILMRSACIAPSAEPSMANSPASSVPLKAVASSVV